MLVVIDLEGLRGKQYKLVFSEMGKEVGGGVLCELKAPWGKEGKLRRAASTRIPTGEIGSNLLAGWLAGK